MTRTMPRETAKVKSPWPKTNAGYLKKNRNSASNMNAPILLEARSERQKFGSRGGAPRNFYRSATFRNRDRSFR